MEGGSGLIWRSHRKLAHFLIGLFFFFSLQSDLSFLSPFLCQSNCWLLRRARVSGTLLPTRVFFLGSGQTSQAAAALRDNQAGFRSEKKTVRVSDGEDIRGKETKLDNVGYIFSQKCVEENQWPSTSNIKLSSVPFLRLLFSSLSDISHRCDPE